MTEQQMDAHVHSFDAANVEVRDYPDRDTWLLARRTLLTSTDVGAIAGVDRFSSALKVYADKLRADDDLEDKASDRMLVGRAMQEGVAEAYRILRQKREDVELAIENVPATRLYLHARHPMHAASMDCWQLDLRDEEARTPLEIKTWNGRLDEPLESWLTQVQWQMHVTGTEQATIACGFGFGEVDWWDVDRDQEIIDALVTDADRFYENHLKPAIPPAGDGSDSATGALRKLYATVNPGLEVELDMSDLDAALAVHSYEQQIKMLQQQREACRQQIMQKMGEAAVAYLPNGQKVTWKMVHRKAHMVRESSSRQFRIWPAPKGE